jgi:Helix-turn-helix domain
LRRCDNLTVITLEQDVRYGFSEFAPAQQVSLPLGLRDLYEIGGRKSGGFGQHRPGDGYGIVPCVLPVWPRSERIDRCEKHTEFDQRPGLDLPDQAAQNVVEMSLHRYLRLRRLWAVRRLLLAGNKPLQIKACALSNGFWHMGEFAALYAAQFGEAPSMTLARARQQLR